MCLYHLNRVYFDKVLILPKSVANEPFLASKLYFSCYMLCTKLLDLKFECFLRIKSLMITTAEVPVFKT